MTIPVCAPVCGWNMVLRDFVYIYIYIYIYLFIYIFIDCTQGIHIIYIMHNMPVASECELSQVDII